MTPRRRAMRELELGLIRASDATLVVTDSERAQVEPDVPGATCSRPPERQPGARRTCPAPSAATGVVFVGGFEHPPNLDAAVMLVRDVMPLVWRELDDVRGHDRRLGPAARGGRAASPRVRVAGWVPDLDPLLDRARAMVAPLTYGAGLKGKVTQALAAGLPVVTTPVGAEGLDAVDGEQMLIADQPGRAGDTRDPGAQRCRPLAAAVERRPGARREHLFAGRDD